MAYRAILLLAHIALSCGQVFTPTDLGQPTATPALRPIRAPAPAPTTAPTASPSAAPYLDVVVHTAAELAAAIQDDAVTVIKIDGANAGLGARLHSKSSAVLVTCGPLCLPLPWSVLPRCFAESLSCPPTLSVSWRFSKMGECCAGTITLGGDAWRPGAVTLGKNRSVLLTSGKLPSSATPGDQALAFKGVQSEALPAAGAHPSSGAREQGSSLWSPTTS